MEVSPVPALCRFVLDNGQRCSSPARRYFHFCRHHSPDALRRLGPRTRPAPNPRQQERAQLALYWRRLHQHIASTSLEGLDDAVRNLFSALGERCISHASAGRLFEAVEDRRRVLQARSLIEGSLQAADFVARNGGTVSDVIENEILAMRRCLQEMTTP